MIVSLAYKPTQGASNGEVLHHHGTEINAQAQKRQLHLIGASCVLSESRDN